MAHARRFSFEALKKYVRQHASETEADWLIKMAEGWSKKIDGEVVHFQTQDPLEEVEIGHLTVHQCWTVPVEEKEEEN